MSFLAATPTIGLPAAALTLNGSSGRRSARAGPVPLLPIETPHHRSRHVLEDRRGRAVARQLGGAEAKLCLTSVPHANPPTDRRRIDDVLRSPVGGFGTLVMVPRPMLEELCGR